MNACAPALNTVSAAKDSRGINRVKEIPILDGDGLVWPRAERHEPDRAEIERLTTGRNAT
jgi:hypothetical protein